MAKRPSVIECLFMVPSSASGRDVCRYWILAIGAPIFAYFLLRKRT